MLEVRLLGKFEVKYNRELINISSRPAQSLFAYLILNAEASHRREKLAGMLWPDSLEETARENLRHALWRLRKALESISSTYLLHVDDVSIGFKESAGFWCDVAELKRLSESASADELMTALSNYNGELLPGFYDEWVVLEREHLFSMFEHHMTHLMALLEEAQRWDDILDWGERWIKLGQKPEPAYRALMSAYAAKGEMSKVAATFERCSKSLHEWGLEPSEQTRTLYEKLKAGKEDFQRAATPPTEKRAASPKTNLPVPLTSFIGREREIEEVKHLISSSRLLTLTGIGGIGKTRLAIQAAYELLRSFKDGVWWVELAPLVDAALIPSSIAQALGLHETPDISMNQSIQGYLREKHGLLILDNCEHLIAACARLADKLLSQCANLKILTTSREALGITGETTFRVPALSFPRLAHLSQIQNLQEFESIQLFVERAAAAHPDLALTQQNAFTVTQICHRLDGIPLAIELAAARVRLLSLNEVATRLDDRFTLLTRGSRTAMPRHQTLRAAIDWSYDLLSADERALFRRLAVFAGGWTFEAAQVVCSFDGIEAARILDLLTDLVNKSLVITHEQDGTTRYQMLETIRQYAREKLVASAEVDQVQTRHLDFFMRLTEESESKLHGPEQENWLERLETEHDNLRAALMWGLEHKAENGWRLAGALWLFWFMHAHFTEGYQRYDEILPELDGMPPLARIRILVGAAAMLWARGSSKEAAMLSDESLALSREHRNKWGIAMSLYHLGMAALQQGDFDQAKTFFEEGLAGLNKTSHWSIRAYLDSGIGLLAEERGDYEQSNVYYEDYLTLSQEHGDKWLSSYALTNLGSVARRQGNHKRADAFYTQALTLSRSFGDMRLISNLLAQIATVAQGQSSNKRAAYLISASEIIREDIGVDLDPGERVEYDNLINAIRAQLGETAFNQLWQEGRTMTLEQAIEFALTETTH